MNNTVSKRTDNSQAAIDYENKVKDLMKRIMLPKKPEGEVYTTSRDISKVFGKEHRRVMQTIRELELPRQFSRHNFVLAKYKDRQGKTRDEYRITEKGFNLLIMGFTGKEAAMYKVAFVEAFEAMQRHLFERKVQWIEDLRNNQDEERRLLLDNDEPGTKVDENIYRAKQDLKGITMRQAQRERLLKEVGEEG